MQGRSRWPALLLLAAACADEPAFAPAAAEAALPTRAPEGTPQVAAPPPEADTGCPGGVCPSTSLLFDASNPYRQRQVVSGSTRLAESSHSRSDCPGPAPDLVYELDLRAATEPVSTYLELRADFDAVLAIETGPPADAFLVACNEEHAPGAQEAFLAVTLVPELYRVVVDGATVDAYGEFALSVEWPATSGRCGAPPANDRCDQAFPIDPDRPLQTFFGTTECASDQAHTSWECGEFDDRDPDVFYGLDLSQRSEPVLLHAQTGLAPTNHDTRLLLLRERGGECAETLFCNDAYHADMAELWARLDPGRYLLAVETIGGTGDFGLSVELAEQPCVVDNDTCATAQALEPRLGVQTLTTWPGCGDDSIVSGCSGLQPSPDIFYRLDLSSFSSPVRVRADARRGSDAFEQLALMAEQAGSCGNELRCGNFDLWLEPRPYYLALNGFRDQQGPVKLTVELALDHPPAPADCIDAAVAACARADREECCSGDGDDCWLSFLSCGLRPEALDCLCETDPSCCGAHEPSYDCAQVLARCGTFCDGFDPVLTCPE